MSKRIRLAERRQRRRASDRRIRYKNHLESCPNHGCDHLNSPNAAYCAKCGAPLYKEVNT